MIRSDRNGEAVHGAIRPHQIPDEVVEALLAHLNTCECKDCTAETIAAALNAWPGAEYVYRQPHRRAVSYSNPAIILPLTQEASEEAPQGRMEQSDNE